MLFLLDLGATVCFAFTGALIAFGHNASIVGVILSAMLTATGGGTIRDVLLRSDNIFWIENEHYLFAVAAALILAYLLKHKVNLGDRALVFIDSLSTAVFVLVGNFAALNLDCGPITTILMGILTGIGGSVLREAIVENHSSLLRDQTITLSVAIGSFIATGLVYIEVNLVFVTVLIGVFMFMCRYHLRTMEMQATDSSVENLYLNRKGIQPKNQFMISSDASNLAAQCRKTKQSRFSC